MKMSRFAVVFVTVCAVVAVKTATMDEEQKEKIRVALIGLLGGVTQLLNAFTVMIYAFTALVFAFVGILVYAMWRTW